MYTGLKVNSDSNRLLCKDPISFLLIKDQEKLAKSYKVRDTNSD